MTKRELEQKARALIDVNPDEAIVIYREIWDNFNDEFNNWDALFSIKTLKKTISKETDWAFELVEKFPEENILNVFSWLVFDKLVKNVSKQELINNESKILNMAQLVSQKNLRIDSSFPCPVTISIFKLCDIYSENLFNAIKINEALSNINPDFLNLNTRSIETEQRGSIELASDYEKYYALKTKALFKLKEYSDCIMKCKNALETISDFHYNNDLWFKMRIALSEDKLGNHALSETLLQELLSSRAGNDKWFLYRDVAEIYFEQGNYEKAWKFSIDASFLGNEPHFLIGLYHLQTKILYKLGRIEDGKLIAELIAAILKEQNWGYKQEYTKLIDFYKIKLSEIDTVNNIHSKLQKFWDNERYKGLERIKGVIISIHKNGKIGRIKSEDNITVDFHKKNLQRKLRNLEELKGNTVEFYLLKTLDGKLNAESIQVKFKAEKELKNELVGRKITGTVKGIKDFGIFVKIEDHKDGLLHKNNLSGIDFNSFKIGQKIEVQIEKITEKGINLKLITIL